MVGLLKCVQRIVAWTYLPHEAAHYIAIWPWSPDPELNLSVPRENWSHPYIPAMGEVKGTIPKGTQKLKVRFAALAPTILYGICGTVALQLPFFKLGSVEYFLTWLAFSFAMLPSGTDLHTAVHPEAPIEAGYFGAENSGAGFKWDVYAVLLAILVIVIVYFSPLIL